ncbi:hypothetical protein BST81_02770 [Leptolyngbya sp. 'hensonii']|uniref:hypothetical protein n=1 Tax=Leptolyngbya sp. 'hensonii' TaxID=1922337 RepID=UPI00094F6BEF|nr:hypothetical protein [Leptolyngbya sp. 'hensonii']OLP20013.1 hypothetical protein BST81_02770 [Leptolyngbya sp. 'hensonii']
MSSEFNRRESFQSQSELELVRALLEFDQVTYPWNPSDPASDAYYAQLEQQFSLDDWSHHEVAHRSQSFVAHLNQLWTRQSLIEKFAARMPHNLLETIVRQAQEVVAANLSLADQLVHCVREVLPAWGEDDLQVMARPLAYAMRGSESEAVESSLGSVRPLPWMELSEIERARLSLAVARYALVNLEQADSDK